MKKIKKIGICIGVLALIIGVWGASETTQAKNIQEGIANKIIRFHVLANSDADEDQQLKLKVKDAVVEKMRVILADAKNVDETRSIINDNLTEIQNFAQAILKQEGYAYPVQAELTKCYFPIKTYGDLTFPAGQYEALRITIGEARGRNWWCVMYPRLCFVDSLHAVVPKESKQELQHILTEEEYKEVLFGGKENVKIKLKLFDWIKKVAR